MIGRNLKHLFPNGDFNEFHYKYGKNNQKAKAKQNINIYTRFH